MIETILILLVRLIPMISEYSEYPSFDQYFMPVLETYNGRWEITEREAKKMIYEKYYSNYSLETLVWKSSEPLIYSRAHRAIYFLFAWKYLERVAKWTYKISEKWIKFLSTWKVMTLEYLRKDEDFHNSSFVINKNKKDKAQNDSITEDKMGFTPEEMLEHSFEQIKASKKDELLQRLREIDPFVFEKVVWTLCEAMWYWTFVETPKSHDWWVDGIIKWDSLGFEKIYIQAKRYKQDNVVNEKEMRWFIGALGVTTVRKAIFFTTSSFAPAARDAARKASIGWNDIILIDWDTLVDLMFEHNVWVQPRRSYELKYIDEDFFDSLS